MHNHFTTHEQANRLLELGISANTADCYRLSEKGQIKVISGTFENEVARHKVKIFPCWSGGALIEIFLLCTNRNSIEIEWDSYDRIIAELIRQIEKQVRQEGWNNSNLEIYI